MSGPIVQTGYAPSPLAALAGFTTSTAPFDQDRVTLACTRGGCGWQTTLPDGVHLSEQVAQAVAHVEESHR